MHAAIPLNIEQKKKIKELVQHTTNQYTCYNYKLQFTVQVQQSWPSGDILLLEKVFEP